MAVPKIDGPLFDALKAAIVRLDTEERRKLYRSGQFPRADRVHDLELRYRWDLYWAANGGAILREWNDPFERQSILDSHIDTALRRIVPALNPKEN